FMMESSRESWAGLPAVGRSRGAQRSRIEDRPSAARASALVLYGEHPAIKWEEPAIPPSPSSVFSLLRQSKFLPFDDRTPPARRDFRLAAGRRRTRPAIALLSRPPLSASAVKNSAMLRPSSGVSCG